MVERQKPPEPQGDGPLLTGDKLDITERLVNTLISQLELAGGGIRVIALSDLLASHRLALRLLAQAADALESTVRLVHAEIALTNQIFGEDDALTMRARIRLAKVQVALAALRAHRNRDKEATL